MSEHPVAGKNPHKGAKQFALCAGLRRKRGGTAGINAGLPYPLN